MSSAFYSLTLGSSTNRSKSKKEAELIKNIKRNRESHHKHAKHSVDTSQTLPSELDFFGSHHASTSTTTDPAAGGDNAVSTSKNKRRKLEHNSDSEANSSSSEDSSSSEEEEEDLPSPPPQKISISAPTTRSLPSSFQSFLSLLSYPLPSPLIDATRDTLARNLKRNGWRGMWGVQGAVAGAMLGLGLDEEDDKEETNPDVMVVAPTGSGKTLSYLLPLILKLGQPARSLLSSTTNDNPKTDNGTGIRAIILLPTHELATQIHSEVLKLLLPSKSKDGPKKNKEEAWRVLMLEKATEAAVIASAQEDGAEEVLGVDVLIATPERLHALVEEKKISLASTHYLILDEADRLLSHEFLLQTRPILGACSNTSLQKAFLSATMEAGPESEARTWLRNGGVRVVVGVKDAATTTVNQQLTFCGSEQGKLLALRNLITSGSLPPPTLIFVQSIERANQLYRQLVMDGNVAEVGVVHSERSKSAREKTVKEFREGKVWMLVVTELMARGLDFKGVEVVVNYDFPQTVQSYIHRIGRTGRAGRKGTAITFFTLEDGPYLRTIANVMRTSGCEVPPWMLELPKPSKNLKKQRRQAPLKRKDVGGDAQSIGKRDINKKRDMIQASKKRKLKQASGPQEKKKQGGSAMEVDLSE